MPFKEQENLEENQEEKNLMENAEIKSIKKEKNEKKEELLNIYMTKIKERLIDEDCSAPDIEDENEKEEREKEEREKEEKKKKAGIHSLNEMMLRQEFFENNIRSRLGELKILLEKKSEVMRRYLNEKIMPLLAKGILNICENIPDDPVEALANFILDNNYNFSRNVNESVNLNDK